MPTPNPRSSPSATVEAARRVRGLFRGPLGCVLALVLLPVVVLLFAAALLANWLGMGRPRDGRVGGGTRRSPAFEVALCSFVRAFSQDEDFAREEALGAPLVATGESIDQHDVLAEAAARGWIAQRGARLHVTARGRDAATTFLREQGL